MSNNNYGREGDPSLNLTGLQRELDHAGREEEALQTIQLERIVQPDAEESKVDKTGLEAP